MNPLIIFGLGDIAELADYYFTHDSGRDVAAFCVDRDFCKVDSFCGKPVVDFETVESLYDPADYDFFVAVAYHDLNRLREQKVKQARQKGYALATYISSAAIVPTNVPIGENCFVQENTVIQPFSTIGNNVTFWSGSYVGHHSVVEDNAFFAAAKVAGHTRVGHNAFLGANVTVKDGITVAPFCLLAAGTVLLQSTRPYEVYTGFPAKKRKMRSDEIKGL